ncbi:MAG: glycoside hydrolase family 38 C-terminal domain-containing protein [bacterium]
MSKKITVHIIANAHLDPVWLWPWQAGLDEVLATCRTMCDLMDEYPDFVFTAGEAWRYQQIESIDPALLERIKEKVANGQWALVGGWWIQPDCNFPGGVGFERQISVGKRYFEKTFGQFPEVAYNVDSFGHAATLPGYMRAAGQKYYVMMRPQEHEMHLPARMFRWQGFPDTPEVLTFHIAACYNASGDDIIWHIRQSMENLPEGITDTMCFVGAGDHGGGPTAKLLNWLIEHKNSIDGCELVLSSPQRFFETIASQQDKLPLVTGELQYHAIGCYSVVRGIKTRVRQAEHRLCQVEVIAATGNEQTIEKGWRTVAFNHFHDILGGTSLPSAYEQQNNQMSGAIADADEILQYELRKRMVKLPADKMQRIVLLNASDAVYNGYVECEPKFVSGGRLLDENDAEVPVQMMQSEQVNGWFKRLLMPLQVEPNSMRIIRLEPNVTQNVPSAIKTTSYSISNTDGTGISLNASGKISFAGGNEISLPRLDLIPDFSDNWTHVIDRYAEGPITSPAWSLPYIIDNGPLMASMAQTGKIGDSTLNAEWRVYANAPYVELILKINWREQFKLLKLTYPLNENSPAERIDGIPGASITRPNIGRETPLRDWTKIGSLAVVSPDVYAVDVTTARARFTLLRSPIITHHDPDQATAMRTTIADQGEHIFHFRFMNDAAITTETLDQQALMMHRPLLVADLTKGMPR